MSPSSISFPPISSSSKAAELTHVIPRSSSLFPVPYPNALRLPLRPTHLSSYLWTQRKGLFASTSDGAMRGDKKDFVWYREGELGLGFMQVVRIHSRYNGWAEWSVWKDRHFDSSTERESPAYPRTVKVNSEGMRQTSMHVKQKHRE